MFIAVLFISKLVIQNIGIGLIEVNFQSEAGWKEESVLPVARLDSWPSWDIELPAAATHGRRTVGINQRSPDLLHCQQSSINSCRWQAEEGKRPQVQNVF